MPKSEIMRYYIRHSIKDSGLPARPLMIYVNDGKLVTWSNETGEVNTVIEAYKSHEPMDK